MKRKSIYAIIVCLLPSLILAQSPFLNPYPIAGDTSQLIGRIPIQKWISKMVRIQVGGNNYTAAIISEDGLAIVPKAVLSADNQIEADKTFFLAREKKQELALKVLNGRQFLGSKDVSGKILSKINPDFPANKKSAIIKNEIFRLSFADIANRDVKKNVKAYFDSTYFFLERSRALFGYDLVYNDPALDWALVRIPQKNITASLQAPDSIQVDSQSVFILGFPESTEYNKLPHVKVMEINYLFPYFYSNIKAYRTIRGNYKYDKKFDPYDNILPRFEQLDTLFKAKSISALILKDQKELLQKIPYSTTYRNQSQREKEIVDQLRLLKIAEASINNIIYYFHPLFRQFMNRRIMGKSQKEKALSEWVDDYKKDFNPKVEQQLLSFCFYQFLQYVPQKYMTKRMATKYLDAGKSVDQWVDIALGASIFTSPNLLKKLNQGNLNNDNQVLAKDYLFQIWEDLNISNSLISAKIYKLEQQLKPIQQAYFEAQKKIIPDFFHHPDANNNPMISQGILIRNKAGDLQLRSQLVKGFEGGIVLNTKGDFLGITNNIDNNIFEFYNDGQLKQYNFISSIDILNKWEAVSK